MTSNQLYRLSGWLLLVGAAGGIVSLLLSDLLLGGSRPTQSGAPLWTVVNLLAMICGWMVILAMTGAYARISARAGWPGLIGWVCLEIANIMVSTGLTAIYMLAVPVLSPGDRRAFDATTGSNLGNPVLLFSVIALLILVVGAITFGLGIGRARVYPSWTGWALIVAGVTTVLGTLLRGALTALPPIIGDSPLLLLQVTQGALGWWLASLAGPELPDDG